MGPSWDHRWVLTAEFSVLPFRFADFIICRFSDTSDPTNFWTLINILSSYFFGNEICRSCSIGSAARPVVGQRRRRLRQSRVAAVGRFGVDAVQRAAVDDAGVAPNVAGVEEQRRRRRRHRRRRRAARRGQPQHQPAFGASFFFFNFILFLKRLDPIKEWPLFVFWCLILMIILIDWSRYFCLTLVSRVSWSNSEISAFYFLKNGVSIDCFHTRNELFKNSWLLLYFYRNELISLSVLVWYRNFFRSFFKTWFRSIVSKLID